MNESRKACECTAAPPPQEGEDEVSLPALNERDLVLYVRSRVVRRLTIIETEAGLYRLRVSLTVGRGELELVTARGMPREWSSLDRLANQIRSKYRPPGGVVLALGDPRAGAAARAERLEATDSVVGESRARSDRQTRHGAGEEVTMTDLAPLGELS
jgi:hypothetical protein